MTITGLVMPAAGDARADDLGGAERDRQDRRVERRGHRPQLEAVEAGELGRCRDRQPRLGRGVVDRGFVGDVVGRERFGDRDRLGARVAQARRPRPRDVGRQAVGDVEELGDHAERASLAQLDPRADGALARLAQVGRPPHADHADPGDVAFEQRVHRLRRRVRDELDALGPTSRRAGDHVHDAGRNTLGVVVRGRHDRLGDDRAGVGVERDGLRERPADVHTETDAHGSVLGVDERALGLERRAAGAGGGGGRRTPARPHDEDVQRAEHVDRERARAAR